MFQVRHSGDRGAANHGWLQSRHSFSFAEYYDPRHMGWGNLRVINEDKVAAGKGFGAHPHRDMEIVSYVLSGALEHRDSMNNGTRIVPGDVQRMTAGTGVVHSEFNAAPETTHFLQIWLLPSRSGLEPSYEQHHVSRDRKAHQMCLVASPEGAPGVLQLNADARIYAGLLDAQDKIELEINPERKGYLMVARGSVVAAGYSLAQGDALMVSSESGVSLSDARDAELIWFDLAP